MNYSMYELLCIFAVYTFLGWLLEVVFVAVTKGSFDNRGFLNGPACPIYGFGSLITLLVLTPFRSNFLVFFAGAVMLVTSLELAAGFLLEKVFHEKWWDYKDEPLNFYGYICMRFSLFWGVGCAFLMYILHPMVMEVLIWLPVPVGTGFIAVSYLLLAADLAITLMAFSRIAENIRHINRLGLKIRQISACVGDNLTDGVSSVIKVKDRRISELEDLIEKSNNLISRNKMILIRLLRFFHPLTRLEDIGRMRRRLHASASGRKLAIEEEYLSTIDDLLLHDCVQQMQQYMQHGDTTTYTHCRAVAYYSVRLCRTFLLHADIRSVARGAMLHDLYLYDWHHADEGHRLHGFYHPGTALANARQYFDINDIEANIIRTHMWPLTVTRIPGCREAVIVCLVDKACSLAETFGYRYRGGFTFEQA